MNFTRKILFYSYTIAFVLFAGNVLLYYSSNISSKTFSSITAAFLITTANSVLGMFSIHFGMSKSAKIFILSFLGGMIARLFLMLAAVFICLKFLQISQNSFIFSILFFYVFYLFIEILYLNQRKRY